ncbi:universal stress protein [Kineococcus sp. SYSU DK004]|uniref:universal stress protein n=1 Tax=Kineococcus sp. SYSU DK004 TaxID=3383125 RepID=UPI003D7CE3B3
MDTLAAVTAPPARPAGAPTGRSSTRTVRAAGARGAGAPVVVGYDGSPDAVRALVVAADDAAGTGSPLHVLTVARLGEDTATTAGTPATPTAGECPGAGDHAVAPVARAEEVLRHAGALVERLHPELPVVRHLHLGPVATALRSAARDARLLVVGARGTGGEFLPGLGDVAAELVAGSPVPVLVVTAVSPEPAAAPGAVGAGATVAAVHGDGRHGGDDDAVVRRAQDWAGRHGGAVHVVRTSRPDERWSSRDDALLSAGAGAGVLVVAAPDDDADGLGGRGPGRQVLGRALCPVLVVPAGEGADR